MKMHANARLSLKGRELLVARVQSAGWSLSEAAEAAGISDRTARKWVARHRVEGRDGLIDRSELQERNLVDLWVDRRLGAGDARS